MSSKYIDIKVAVWQRHHLPDNAKMKLIVKGLKAGKSVNDVLEEQDIYDTNDYENETLFETEEGLTPDENEGNATVEVWDDDVQVSPVWTNAKPKSL